jgi:hypothetical protein
MALSPQFVEAHIAHWERQLGSVPFYPHRVKWPSRLFHHTPIENAAELLKRGALLSRSESEGSRVLDIADAAVIANRESAHNSARLYFRPRTPTQYSIEGVRKRSEYYRGEDKHAPTLAMFIFDARKILTQPGVRFSDGNMQSYGTADGDSEEFFSQIDFQRVFHEGGVGYDPQTKVCRCAEVLAPSPLAISETLLHIYCRSQPERSFLLYRLGDQADQWAPKIFVSDDIRVFEKGYTLLDHLAFGERGLDFELKSRKDGAEVELGIRVLSPSGQEAMRFGTASIKPVNQFGGRRWYLAGQLPSGTYFVEVHLERCLVFQGNLIVADAPF